MEGFPHPVADHSAVWTGTEMLVFGGDQAFPSENNGYAPVPPVARADGGIYEPSRDRWRPLPRAPIAPRFDHVAVWTGREMLVFGGRDADTAFSDGAAFDPVKGSWRMLATAGGPDSGRSLPGYAWTGTELWIIGGADASGHPVSGAFAYDPIADAWRTVGALPPRAPAGAVWTGTQAIAWAGAAPDGPAGVRFDGEHWVALPTAGAPKPRPDAIVAWAGDRMVLWGGLEGDDNVREGARFDPATDRWTPMSTDGAFAPANPASVSFGDVVAILGEAYDDDDGALPSLALYDVAKDTWRTLPGPYPSADIAMVWTGTELLAWGGFDGTNMSATGERVRLR